MSAWDWSEFTSGHAGLSLLGRSIRDSITVDVLEGKDDFVAVALTDLFPLSAEQMMGIDAASTSVSSRGNPRYGFHGRALGPQSPVSWLPDPCDPARAGTSPEQKATNWWLIKAHTLFYTTSTDDSFNITRGDKVHVRFDHLGDPPYRYNVKYGKIIGVAAHENPQDQGECASLIDLFGSIARGAVPISAGSTGTTPCVLDSSGMCVRTSTRIGQFVTFPVDVSGLHADARAGFQGLIDMVNGWGNGWGVDKFTSGRRSVYHQADLLKGGAPGAVGAPCYSDHQYGAAIDIIFKGPGRPSCPPGGFKTCQAYGDWVKKNIAQHPQVPSDVKFSGYGFKQSDFVHWSHTNARTIVGNAKQKCIDYYYNTDWRNTKGYTNWPAPLGTTGSMPRQDAARAHARQWPKIALESNAENLLMIERDPPPGP